MLSCTLLKLLSSSLCSSCKILPSKTPTHTPTFYFSLICPSHRRNTALIQRIIPRDISPPTPRTISRSQHKRAFPARVSNSRGKWEFTASSQKPCTALESFGEIHHLNNPRSHGEQELAEPGFPAARGSSKCKSWSCRSLGLYYPT